jgi:hypothetical protein
MSEYSGTFEVISQWTTNIVSGTAQHRTTDYGTTILEFNDLKPGGQTNQSPTFTSSTSNKDRWSISFTDETGRLYVAANNCGFHEADNGGVVQLFVNQPSLEFSEVMPSGSSCDTSLSG